MKFILFSIPFCRWYYLVCSIMLLWMLVAKITGPEVILLGVSDEPFLRPGYYTLVMMHNEGQWHKVFSEDKKQWLPEGYTLDNIHLYYNSKPWSAKPIGKVICWTTGALFALVLLSPFWHQWRNQKLLFLFLTVANLLLFYWLQLERGDESLYLQSNEYMMTIPCLLVWAGCLYRIIFYQRMQWDPRLGQAALGTHIVTHRRCFMLCALLFPCGAFLLLSVCYFAEYFLNSIFGFFLYRYGDNIIQLLCFMILVAVGALLIVLFPKKVAALLV